MVTFLLVRHGESLYNMQRCFTGHSDIPLTELGEKQAELTAQYLTEHFKVDAIWSSDLQRAKSTAKPCADRLGLPIHCDSDLRETNVGEWQDRLFADVCLEYPHEIEKYRDRTIDFRFPGGENSAEVYARASRALARIAAENDGKTVAVFSHGGVIRTLCRNWLGLKPEQFHEAPMATNASVTVVRYDNGTAELLQISYDEHLKNADPIKNSNVI